MSEEKTRNLSGGRSFEERVFARFDALDARFNTMLAAMNARFDALEARVEALEEQAERRTLETKPMWERALAEILEVKESVADVARKLDVLSSDVMTVRADQLRLDRRLGEIESRLT